MAGERAAIFGHFIEQMYESNLSPGEREEVYTILLEVLEEFEIKGIDAYLNIDPSFDEMFSEKYPPELEEYDD